MAKAIIGRPIQLTEDKALAIAQAVQTGLHPAVASQVHGIDGKLYYKYMQRGRKEPEGIFGAFRELVLHAQAEFERETLAMIRVHALISDCGAEHLKWIMERRFPTRWGKGTGELARIRKQLRELEREVIKSELQRSATPN